MQNTRPKIEYAFSSKKSDEKSHVLNTVNPRFCHVKWRSKIK